MDGEHVSKKEAGNEQKAAQNPAEEQVEGQSVAPLLNLNPDNMLNFQRMIGNRAIQRLVNNAQIKGSPHSVKAPPNKRAPSVQRDAQGKETAEQETEKQLDESSVTGAFSGASGDDPRPVIQRAPNNAPVKEFIPRLSAFPGTAVMFMFGRHKQIFQIDNRSDAPGRTQFHWGFGIATDDVLRIVGHKSLNNGATERIEVEAQRPGQTSIQATPVHQVPGGPQVTGPVQHAKIIVEPPTVELLSKMYRKADGGGINSNRLAVGDKMIARIRVGNVEGKHMQDPKSAMVTGQGADLVSVGNLKPVQRFNDGRSYDVEFIANKIGSVDIKYEPGIGESVLGTGPKASGITAEIEYTRAEFSALLSQVHTKIDLAYTRANSIMEKLSAAYGNAFEGHEKTLKAQDASNRLAGEILLGAALAFIPGGIGGEAGVMMNAAKNGAFLADGVKDLVKFGLRTGGAAGLTPDGGDAMHPMSTDPRTWRADYATNMNTEKEKALKSLDGWQTKFNGSDPDFYLNFNPVTTIDDALKNKQGKALKDISVPDQKEHEKKFELGFWKEWLTQFGFTVEVKGVGYSGTTFGTSENQGKKIRDRINDLGENGDQFLATYGGISKKKAEDEAERRNNEQRALLSGGNANKTS
jgi:hypothetical protein